MAYSRFYPVWGSGPCCGEGPDPGQPNTPITKDSLNHIEQGIFDAAADADTALATAGAAQADANDALIGNVEASESPVGYDVILLVGQSNMVGLSGQAASASLDPAVTQVFQLKQDNTIVAATEFLDHPSTPTGVGPGFPFARNYVKAGLNRGRKVLLVPSAVVATPLVTTSPPTWNSTVAGSLLDAAITRANTAIAAEPGSKIVAILWIQGGADASAGATQTQYANALDALISDVRTNITEAAGVPFILSSEPPEADGIVPNMVNIRAALADTPNRNTKTYYVSPPSNMVVAGNLHFSNAGYRTIGQKLFDGYQAVRAGIYVDSVSAANTSDPIFPAGMHVSGRYFQINSVVSTTAVPTLNELRLYPWPVEQTLPLSGLYCQVGTAGSGDSVLRVGIYADDGTGVPGALVMELGAIATATNGVKEISVPSSLTLPKGLYWVGGVTQGTTAATMVVVTQNQWAYKVPVIFGAAAFNDTITGVRQTGVSGALPATFTNGGGTTSPVRFGYKVL